MTKTNSLTQAILKYLNYSGKYVAWRNGSHAVYSVTRKAFLKNPTTKLGIPDILGYRKSDSRFLAIEIKTGKDKLSLEQVSFIQEAKKSLCICFVASDFDQFLAELKKY